MKNLLITTFAIASGLLVFMVLKETGRLDYANSNWDEELISDLALLNASSIPTTTVEPKVENFTDNGEALIPIKNDLLGYTAYITAEYTYEFYGSNQEELLLFLKNGNSDPEELFNLEVSNVNVDELTELKTELMEENEVISTEISTPNQLKWSVLRGYIIDENTSLSREMIVAVTESQIGSIMITYHLNRDTNAAHTNDFFTLLQSLEINTD